MNPYALTRSQQKLLAVALLVLALFAAVTMICLPLQSQFADKTRRVSEMREQIMHWESIIASEADLRAAQQAFQNEPGNEQIFIPASSNSQAAASVQAFVRRVFQNADSDIKSLEPLPVQEFGTSHRVAVRVIAMVQQDQLDQILEQFWYHEPALGLETFQIKAGGSGRRVKTDDFQTSLQIDFTVFALMAPSDDA